MEEFRSDEEASEGGLKELVRRWFTDTQASHILHDGNLPDWFHGFAARKDTEDLLKDKSPGCFLIRLSDKAIGYILSYKGCDRCRHLVISQNTRGQFTVRGGCQTYSSVTELVDFHRFSPIQPFRELLTSTCHQVDGGELYDVVSRGTSGPSVLALRSRWDQKHGRSLEPPKEPQRQQLNEPLVLPPALPPKSNSRKLRAAVSVDMAAVSPVRLSRSPSQAMAEHHSCHVQTWAQVGPKRSQSPRGATNWEQRQLGGLYPVGTELSEKGQVDKSRASWRLKSNTEEDQSSSRPSSFWPAPLKATRSLHEPGWSSSASTPPAEDEEFRTNPLYHTSEGPEEGPPQQGGLTYSEVLQRPTGPGRSERTYEQIPKEPEQGNTYESVEEVKTKKESTWGRNNKKWRHFLPGSRKK